MAVSVIGGASASSSSASGPLPPAGYAWAGGGIANLGYATVKTGTAGVSHVVQTDRAAAGNGAQVRFVAYDSTGAFYNYVCVGSSIGSTSNTLTPPTNGTIKAFSPWAYTSFSPGGNNSAGVAYLNGAYYCGGGAGYIYRSTDGMNWSQVGAINTANSPAVVAFAYGNGVYVAAGRRADNSSNMLATSTNGTTWTSQTVGNSDYACDMVFGNGVFVAVRRGGTANSDIVTSTDGVTWTIRTTTGATSMYAVAHNGQSGAGSMFVAFGSGTIFSSVDGTTWTSRTNPTSGQAMYSVVWSGTQFVAAGSNGYIITSSDGITWTNQGAKCNGENLYEIAYGNGRYIVSTDTYASSGSGTQKGFWASTDAITWLPVGTPSGSTTAYGSRGQLWGGRFMRFCNDRFFANFYNSLCYSTDGLTTNQPTIFHIYNSAGPILN